MEYGEMYDGHNKELNTNCSDVKYFLYQGIL